jgi:hypothetical protein
MIELRQEFRRLTLTVEVIVCVVGVPIVFGFLFVLGRFIRWAVDRNYHLFSK